MSHFKVLGLGTHLQTDMSEGIFAGEGENMGQGARSRPEEKDGADEECK